MPFKELETGDDRPRCEKPQTAHTPRKVKAIKEKIRRKSKRSMWKMAKEMKICAISVRTIVKKDLRRYVSFKMKRQQLTDFQEEKRFKIFLNHLKSGTDAGEIFFRECR